jgi:asparagine synthase (glutamine-hydrolysing)
VCGIAGIFSYRDQAPVDASALERMVDAMAHRGPDDDGVHVDREAGVGVRRLSIIDVEGGHQPIFAAGGRYCVVSNGEIYNYRELRRELGAHGHTFATASDTEVVAHAYEQWGLAALSRFNGIFGVAVWDAVERRLTVARDPFGVKPVYWHDDGGRLVFASEIRSLLAAGGIQRRVDVTAMEQYLRYRFVPAPRTAFAGISKLPAGHCLEVSHAGVRLTRYSEPPADVEVLHSDADDIVDDLRTHLRAAVERQMVSDVPIGVLLSGGADSTALATLVAQASQEKITTFSIGFGDDYKDDELTRARATAARLGADHHELRLGRDEFASFLPDAVWMLEEPVATSSTYPFYRLCRMARETVKVVLSGQGADEPFAGYERALAERYGAAYRALPSWMRARLVEPAIGLLPRNEQLKRAVFAVGQADPAVRLDRVYSIIDDDVARKLSGPDLLGVVHERMAEPWRCDVTGRDSLAQLLYVDARFSLSDNLLIYGDKLSMAASVELRVPYLDLELMAFAERIPSSLKVHGLQRKYVFKKAVSEWVPEETLRGRKIGFNTPVDAWFRGPLAEELLERVGSQDSAAGALLDRREVVDLVEQHVSGRHNHQRILYALLILEHWHEQYIAPSDDALQVRSASWRSRLGAVAR